MDNNMARNNGRPISQIDPGARVGGRDIRYRWLSLGWNFIGGGGGNTILAGDVLPDGTVPTTVAVAGTSAQSQCITHAFAVASASTYDHINVPVPNDYHDEGGMTLRLIWYCADATLGKKAHWTHTWKVVTPNGTEVFNAAGTAGTAVDTAVGTTTLFITESELVCPTTVSDNMKPGQLLSICFRHKHDDANTPGSAIYLIGAFLVYKRA